MLLFTANKDGGILLTGAVGTWLQNLLQGAFGILGGGWDSKHFAVKLMCYLIRNLLTQLSFLLVD